MPQGTAEGWPFDLEACVFGDFADRDPSCGRSRRPSFRKDLNYSSVSFDLF
jgi:hypothetical protein